MDLDERIFQIPIMQRPSCWRRGLAFLMAAAVNVLLFYSLGVVRSEPSLEDVPDGKTIRILAVDLLRTKSSLPETTEPEPAYLPLVAQEVPAPAIRSMQRPRLSLAPRLPVGISGISAELPGLPIALPGLSDLRGIPGPPVFVAEEPLSSSFVDRVPVKIAGAEPYYPSWARRARLEGTVTLRFVVTKEGKVENVKIHEFEGDERFGREAAGAIGNWLFEPTGD